MCSCHRRKHHLVCLITFCPLISDLDHRLDSHFPVELLDQILTYVDQLTLAKASFVSHTFHDVSSRLLYRHIPVLSLRHTVLCLRTLASCPDLALLVRSYQIGDMDTMDMDRTRSLLRPFYTLLAQALRNMSLITELDFLLTGPTACVLLGTSFRLTKVTASCDFDSSFSHWLTEQHKVCTALFCGRFISGTMLAFSALPLLRRVSASPLILACVVPGRPVREVELCLVHPWLLNEAVLATTMQIVSYSKGPLQSLQIISHLTESSENILAALRVIPGCLSNLDTLALHAVSGSITSVRVTYPLHLMMSSPRPDHSGTTGASVWSNANPITVYFPEIADASFEEQARYPTRSYGYSKPSVLLAYHLHVP